MVTNGNWRRSHDSMIGIQEIKLNLGSWERKIPGFQNMDIDPHPGVDFVGDVSDLSKFENNSISQIYASHILEHFPSNKTLSVLKEWHRVLTPGGILYVGVPDFERVVELYKKIGLCDWVQNFLWGDQGYKTAFHYAGFDEKRLRELLKRAGFSEMSRVENFPFGIKDCSMNRSNLDGKSVSLNLLAIK